ncbi:MAG TPA: CoA-acylating methylmalonate-semialdehyde dehydrogenase [Acidimicrobiia bacterium]|nr:CoA-acylating methylmalonate-semialdehyde dehydrogenase [Acidimicrobiia bacterium]
MKQITHWIDNKPFNGKVERWGDVYDPATGIVQAHVAMAAVEQVDLAVASARRAWDTWKDVSLARRTSILFAFRDLVESHKDDIARLLVSEHGKVLSDAQGEVQRGLEVIEFACGIPQLVKGEYNENVSRAVDTYSIRQPVGVVAGITPFNFPAMVPMWMYPIAIACGNTFVLKPSEKDPSAANFSAELFMKAGLPEGVFNVIHGDKVAVDRILIHPDIGAVSFVGSTPIARYVYETGTRSGKRVAALGGAKNHMIVLPDADMDLAADAAVSAGYGSAGERCMAISVLVTVGDAAEKLMPKVIERLHKIKVASGLENGAEMGPLVTAVHRDKVVGYIEQGVAEGAMLVADGRNLMGKPGFFVGPTLFDHVTPAMTIYRDEIFGPVLSTVRVDSYDEAMKLLDDNPWANGVAIFTNDGGAARKFQNEAQAGMIGVNVPIPVPMAYHSFGGWKASIFGDARMYGIEGVNFYTRLKVVTSRWPDPAHRGVNLGFPQMK